MYCDACRSEYRLAFSCARRGLCPSCAAKRGAIFGAFVHEEVLEEVGHCMWTFTVPKLLRPFFLHRRELLGPLCRAAWETVAELVAEAAGKVVVFDDDHYYMGNVLAEGLVAQGVEVCFVTPESLVSAWGVMTDEQFETQQHLIELGVEIITAHGLDEFDGSSARLSCVYTERTRVLEADAVVLVTTRAPVDGPFRDFAAKPESEPPEPAPTLHKIGDCDAPAIIASAVCAGHRYARELGSDAEEHHIVRQDKLFDPD